MGELAGKEGASANPTVAEALARSSPAAQDAAVEGPVGWPGTPAPGGGGLGWPADTAGSDSAPPEPASPVGRRSLHPIRVA